MSTYDTHDKAKKKIWDDESKSLSQRIDESSAYDKVHGIRRTRFAEYDARRAGECVGEGWDRTELHTVHVAMFLISEIDQPAIWSVGWWCVPLLDYEDLYVGSDQKAAWSAWERGTNGKRLSDVETCSGLGYGRREDWPRWICGEATDLALRNSGWENWTTDEWVAHLWDPKIMVQSWVATEHSGKERVVAVYHNGGEYHYVSIDGRVCHNTFVPNDVAPIEAVAFAELMRRGWRIVEWRRSDEPSRAQMRAALESCEKFMIEPARDYDFHSKTNPTLVDQEPVAVFKLAKDALSLVRAALGR